MPESNTVAGDTITPVRIVAVFGTRGSEERAHVAVNLAAALSPEGEAGGDDEDDEDEGADCVTVAQCVARNAAAYSAFLATQPNSAAIQAAVGAAGEQCWEDVQPSLGVTLANCE